jgi:hypothetical protein
MRIAAWAALKAMVAEYDAHGWVTTHHLHRAYLMRNFTPPPRGWVIWIGPYIRKKWVTQCGSTPWLYLSDKQERRRGSNIKATYYNSHISTQVIGQLYIHVIRSPARGFIDRWRFTLPDRGSFFRIWPASSTSINWPGQPMTDRDADYIAGALYDFLIDRTFATIRAAEAQGASSRAKNP